MAVWSGMIASGHAAPVEPLPNASRRTRGQRAGDAAEDFAADRLRSAGWTILGRNVHVGRRELDLVAIDPGPPEALVVVEVRWRSRRDFGLAEESVDRRKLAHLRAAIGRLIEDGLPGGAALPSLAIRLDLIVVEPPIRAGEAPRVRHHRAIPL
jgi:putative endonuclease